jgi:hypothetical protein
LPQAQDQTGIDGGEQGGEQPVDQGAADEPVDVIQPIAQDGDADRHRDQREADPNTRSPTGSGGVPLLVESGQAGSHRRILRGGGDSLIHHHLLEL